eukprot:Skav216180  [mRNA]  locus=scaffold2249:124226:133669:+ [translate_table: standard]
MRCLKDEEQGMDFATQSAAPRTIGNGLDDRDVAFMQRLRRLASEALTWPHLRARQQLVWASTMTLDAVPLDGRLAVRCSNTTLSHREVKRFVRLGRWVYKAAKCILVTSSLRFAEKDSRAWLATSGAALQAITPRAIERLQAKHAGPCDEGNNEDDPPLRDCQRDCLEACAKGARVIEMACGTGKTRIMKELVKNVLITVPLRALLDQFAPDFPGFCKVGTGYNKEIDFKAHGFIAVTDSVHLLKKLKFATMFVDEAHHPLPVGFPKCKDLYQLSATHQQEPDFGYTMGQAIEDGVLCDYDITVPVVSKYHTYVCLADLLLKQAGKFRRILAYCNSVAESKRFQMVLEELGMAAWHINAKTPVKKRAAVIEEFAGPLLKPAHVLVTVEVLGEGINIPNADTCMFVEPRRSYRSIVQAIGRVLRHHPTKAISHIILPAVVLPNSQLPENLGGSRRLRQNETKGQPPFGSSSDVEKDQPVSNHTLPSLLRGQQESQTSEIQNKIEGKPDAYMQQSEKVKMPSLPIPNVDGTCIGSADPCWKSTSHPNSKRLHDEIPPLKAGSDKQKISCEGKVADSQSLSLKVGNDRGGRSRGIEPDARVQQDGHTICRDRLDMHEHQPVEEPVRFPQADPGYSNAEGLEAFAQEEPSVYQSDAVKAVETTEQMPNFRRTIPVLPRKARCKSPLVGMDDDYESQVDRFLAVLVQADHRLVGTMATHRIQVVDCSLSLEGEMTVDEVFADVYGRLTALLRQTDPWEIRLQKLEDFVQKEGRLPRSLGIVPWKEKSLGVWLRNQGAGVLSKKLLAHRLQRLMNSSLSLVRRRTEGWITGDRDMTFQRRCVELRKYVNVHGIPSYPHPLFNWLHGQRIRGMHLDPTKLKMLQDVHPLVADMCSNWDSEPAKIVQDKWDARLRDLNAFAEANWHLPRQRGREGVLWRWFWLQLRRVQRGVLPSSCIQKFETANRLGFEAYASAAAAVSGAAKVSKPQVDKLHCSASLCLCCPSAPAEPSSPVAAPCSAPAVCGTMASPTRSPGGAGGGIGRAELMAAGAAAETTGAAPRAAVPAAGDAAAPAGAVERMGDAPRGTAVPHNVCVDDPRRGATAASPEAGTATAGAAQRDAPAPKAALLRPAVNMIGMPSLPGPAAMQLPLLETNGETSARLEQQHQQQVQSEWRAQWPGGSDATVCCNRCDHGKPRQERHLRELQQLQQPWCQPQGMLWPGIAVALGGQNWEFPPQPEPSPLPQTSASYEDGPGLGRTAREAAISSEEGEGEAIRSASDASDLWHGLWRQHQERRQLAVGLEVAQGLEDDGERERERERASAP